MIVVDASVWMSFLLQQDVHHTVTRPWVTRTLTAQRPIAAPIILLSEIGGAVSRRTNQPEIGQKAINQLLKVPTLRLITVDHTLGLRASQIAADFRVRGADSLYIAAAAELGVPLVSWDQEQLSRAADLIAAYTPVEAP